MNLVSQRRVRRGFSVLELLIVMAIIGVLFALTAGAAMRYSDVQRKKNTEWLLQKLESSLHTQWNAVIAQAKDEAVPPAVLTMAGNDGQRARVVYIKLRLMQEFPMTFAEATNPANGMLPPRPTYAAALQGKKAPTGGTVGGLDMQSSICLYLALQQDRGGTKFNVDSNLTSNEKKIDPTSGMTYIADQWGNSLAFFRWPTGNPEITNPGTNATTSSMTAGNNDPEDPLGLLSTSWNSAQFTSMCHQVSPGKSFFLAPCIASAGRNGKWGFNTSKNAWESMTPLTSGASAKDNLDNLYGYRLRMYGRGD